MILALAGNQNSGKTTLFNALTGSNQHVGNFPGVTVEQKSGILKSDKDVTIVDLPGIYSLSPFTQEEIVTRDFLIKSKPDGIINIVDATNIERNLYLSLQLIELRMPMVIALNMMDEMRDNGSAVDTDKLSEQLGVPVVPISAGKGEGIEALMDKITQYAEDRRPPERMDFCSGAVHRAIHAVVHMIEDHAARAKVPVRFAAAKIIEGDEPLIAALKLDDNERHILRHISREIESELNTQSDAALADMRYEFIEHACAASVSKGAHSKSFDRSVKIDALLTHKVWALPIFLAVMLLTFWLSFNVIGGNLSDLLAAGIDFVTDKTELLLNSLDVNQLVVSLVVDGVLAGIGSVLSFLPIIAALFFFLSLLEDSGYMARVAFLMDKLLRRFGLSGRSFVPLLIGFGCSVPAIMATRTLGSERERRMTVLLVPFVSCSAKLPVYAMFTAAFFPRQAAVVMLGLYVVGIGLGILFGKILNKSVFVGKSSPFIMELPPYRLPSLKSTTLLVWGKAKDFITRAFTIIFLSSIIIWFLRTLDFRFNVVADGGDSMLASLGRYIAPVLNPAGFGDWRAATAVISGFVAKETVVSTLTVLMGPTGLLSGMFTPLTAFAFLIFVLLYTPCVAAVSVTKRELGGKIAAVLVCFQMAVAYAAATLFYQIARLFVK